MVRKVFEPIDIAAERYTGLARKAIDYGRFQKKIMDRAVDPNSGYTPEEWLGLKEFVADDFKRIGTFKEEWTFDEMIKFLQAWAPNAHWEGSFKRVTEVDNVVFLELEERGMHIVNTISVYEFNDEGKLRHLDVLWQAPPMESLPIDAYKVND